MCADCRTCKLEQASPEGLRLHHEGSRREVWIINRTMNCCQLCSIREKHSRTSVRKQKRDSGKEIVGLEVMS